MNLNELINLLRMACRDLEGEFSDEFLGSCSSVAGRGVRHVRIVMLT